MQLMHIIVFTDTDIFLHISNKKENEQSEVKPAK